MRLGLRAEEAPVLGGIHLGALLFEAVHKVKRELLRVGVAEHVPLPDQTAHARQLHAHGLEPAPATLLETLFARSDLAEQFGVAGFRQTRVLPVTVREQHARHFPSLSLGSIKIARHEESWGAFEIDF